MDKDLKRELLEAIETARAGRRQPFSNDDLAAQIVRERPVLYQSVRDELARTAIASMAGVATRRSIAAADPLQQRLPFREFKGLPQLVLFERRWIDIGILTAETAQKFTEQYASRLERRIAHAAESGKPDFRDAKRTLKRLEFISRMLARFEKTRPGITARGSRAGA